MRFDESVRMTGMSELAGAVFGRAFAVGFAVVRFNAGEDLIQDRAAAMTAQGVPLDDAIAEQPADMLRVVDKRDSKPVPRRTECAGDAGGRKGQQRGNWKRDDCRRAAWPFIIPPPLFSASSASSAVKKNRDRRLPPVVTAFAKLDCAPTGGGEW
jgi:hypothetical protein